jgi:hypothetical protein
LQDLTPSESLDGKPSRRRRRTWLSLTGLVALVVAFTLLAWPQGGDDGGDGPLNAIAKAAERTQGMPGGRATMHAVVSSEESESITITGQMEFNTETDRSRGTVRAPRTGSSGPMDMEIVTDGAVMYMRSSNFGSLPGGREWMGLDFSSFGLEMDAPVPAGGDVMGELKLLEEATGKVQKLGKEVVRGTPTTRYHSTVGVSEQAEELREEGADELASYVEEKGAPLRIEVWIDADGLVRRMRIVKSQPAAKGEGPSTTDMRMDFFDFTHTPEIDVPDESEVFDATSVVEDQVGLSD